MKKLLKKVRTFFRKEAAVKTAATSLSSAELEREAGKFVEKYGDVLKKLARE
jgi:hypothetical protein